MSCLQVISRSSKLAGITSTHPDLIIHGPGRGVLDSVNGWLAEQNLKRVWDIR